METILVRRNQVTDNHFPAIAGFRGAIWEDLRLQAGMANPDGYRLTTDRRLGANSGALPFERAHRPSSSQELS